MLDMSKLIEDSQGEDGKLELIVWPGGSKAAEKTVTVQIEAVGRFSRSWPFDCPRSDKLMTDLCEFLADDYKRAGRFESRVHSHSAAVLALMASGDRRYDRLVKSIMSGYGNNRYDPNNGNGFPAWNYGHDAIVMGEYYLLTQDKSLLPAIKSLSECLIDAQTPNNGGYSHKPDPFIQRRIFEGGPKGYGPMSLPGGLAMIGMSLFKEAGLDYAAPAYERVHQAFLRSVGPNGSIDYGFKALDHAVLKLGSADAAKKGSPRGIGYEIESGMTALGDYLIEWPTKADPRYRPTDWVSRETNTNAVYDMGGDRRLVVRNMPEKAPTRPYQHNGQPVDHYARSGTGALAHAIGNADNKPFQYLSDFMATACAKSPNSLLDGHASTHMHVLWGSLGAALASEKDFQRYMEGIKWWFIMAQTHDAGFVVMPGRDYASTDHIYGTRVFPSASAALILSVKERRLQITGAMRDTEPRDQASNRGAGSSRPARELALAKRKLLDRALLTSLGELSQAGQLTRLPMEMSKATARVWLVKVESDARLTYQAMEGERQSSFAFEELNAADHALLARLVARLRPDNAEAQAAAGIYLELNKETPLADDYYEKAGAEFQEILKGLFE